MPDDEFELMPGCICGQCPKSDLDYEPPVPKGKVYGFALADVEQPRAMIPRNTYFDYSHEAHERGKSA